MKVKGKSFKTRLKIKTYTWAWDSHGLFDYENKDVNKKLISIQDNGISYFAIYRIYYHTIYKIYFPNIIINRNNISP